MSTPSSSPRDSPWRITTSQNPALDVLEQARKLAQTMELPYSVRGGSSITRLGRRFPGVGWLIAGPRRSLTCITPNGQRMRWHLGLAKSRIAAANRGQPDYLLQSLEPKPGERYFDGTLGMAHDALLVASRGAEVVAMEIDPIVHALTSHGLQALSEHAGDLPNAATRVTTVAGDHTHYLRGCITDAFDGVFFSPMFVDPRFHAVDLEGLREIAHCTWLHPEALSEARRVSRKVILKLERGCHPALPTPSRWIGSSRRRLTYALYER